MNAVKDRIGLEFFSRIRIGETDPETGKVKIIGDSGWTGPNQVVNLGFQDYICAAVGGVAGSKQVTHMALGTGTAPGAADTDLAGETGDRKTSDNSVVSSKTMQATAAWASGDHPGGTPTLQNVGLFNTSAGGPVCCGNTYATSDWQSNQGVSATYQMRFT